MRVNPNPLPDLLAALAQNQQQINTDLNQIASGQSVSQPSDNPAGAAILTRNADQTSEADQFLRSIGSVQGEMQNADSALNSVVTALQRAISLGTEGANGTVNSSDRQALATEVQGIQSQLLNLANLSYQGNFVFAGTATQTAPYVSGASGISYVGNDNANNVTVGDHLTAQTNLPGSQLFSASGHDMFQAVQDLINNLQSGSNIDTAVNEVSDAYSFVNAQRVFYGNSINQLNAQQTFLNNETTQLAQQQSTVGGADLSKVISNLVSAETSRQASLEAVADTQKNNLFDYLK
ncbi:MAG TPA: flagellar hook-associated protein FlgL [Candidatus Sulfotelmatobacter sp.]|nr:flagellar hook-associated protein FlgL [Candidatus Sulfotelmatobacter sp.]